MPGSNLIVAAAGDRAGHPLADLDVWPEGPELRLILRGSDGEAHVWLPTTAVSAFLQDTNQVVPVGEECDGVDWSVLLTDIAW